MVDAGKSLSKFRWLYRVPHSRTGAQGFVFPLVARQGKQSYRETSHHGYLPPGRSHSASRRGPSPRHGPLGSHRNGVTIRAPRVPFVNVAVASASDPAHTSEKHALTSRLGPRVPSATIRETRTRCFQMPKKYGAVTCMHACVGISR